MCLFLVPTPAGKCTASSCLCLQLQMLVKAGADILMPVMVDGDVGTAMDYAYYSFHQV